MKPITAKFDRLVEKSWLKKIDAPSLSHYNAFLYNTMANVTLNDVSSNSLYFEFSHLEDSLNKNLQVDWKWYFLVKSLRLFANINHKMAIWVKRGGGGHWNVSIFMNFNALLGKYFVCRLKLQGWTVHTENARNKALKNSVHTGVRW